jgi:RHS repeat-associated protein
LGYKALTYQNFLFLEVVHQKKATTKFILGLYGDHLGNVRLSYKNISTTGVNLAIVEENNYYPFGLKHKGYNNVVVSENKYQTFNGKEFEESLGLNVVEMDWRQYEPSLGRFYNPDRLAALVPSLTPYRFGYNNPILWSDPSGLIERSVLMDLYNRSGSGSTTWTNDSYSGFDTAEGDNVDFQNGGITVYYTQRSLDMLLDDIEVLTISYYDDPVTDKDHDRYNMGADDVSDGSPLLHDNIFGQQLYHEEPLPQNLKNTIGLPTVSQVRTLGATEWSSSATFYDYRGTPVYTGSYNETLDLE